jgi:glycosyltransferase involved in cell wall biosynthesis
MASSAGTRPRVTLFVHDLAGNAVVRAAPLAAALSPRFEVVMAGLLLSGPAVYAPYRERFAFRALPVRGGLASVLAAAPRLARAAGGDVLYACKPLLTTLLPAVLAARGRPLLLDVEDDEWAERSVEARPGLGGALRRMADTHPLQARAAHLLTGHADAVTVASRALQRRYGGTLLRHGPDEAEFDRARPDLADRDALRRAFGLPPRVPVALFAGRPRPHKGWDVLLDALASRPAAGWHLAAAGDPPGPAFARAAQRLGGRFHFLGAVANDRMPALLAAADAVPVPQRPTAFARAQLPAKLLEALAMEVPVVGTEVGDVPEILGPGLRGWVVPPDDAAALAAALGRIAEDPAEAARRAGEGRRWFVAEASVGALRARLVPLVEGLLERGG